MPHACQNLVNLENDLGKTGEGMILLGEEAGQAIRAGDLAEWAGSIPNEILTNISARVARV